MAWTFLGTATIFVIALFGSLAGLVRAADELDDDEDDEAGDNQAFEQASHDVSPRAI